MMPKHHPLDEMLLSYAAGKTKEPLALLVATHLASCPSCRNKVAAYEEMGGDLLEELEPDALDDDSLAAVLERLDQESSEIAGKPATGTSGDLRLPRPLRDYVAGRLEDLNWKRRGLGVAEVPLLANDPTYRSVLMRIRAKTAVPEHSHRGTEYTLVLAGGFSDRRGHYLPGDVAVADQSVAHRPIADPGEDCICLAVTDAPLYFTGPIARLLNPLLPR